MAKDNGSRIAAKGVEQTGTQSIYFLRTLTAGGSATLDKRLPATYATFRKIRKQPTVALVRALSIAPIVAGTWRIEADDEVPDDQVRFIKDQIMPLREPMLQKCMEDGIDYGWSPWEKVLEIKKWEGQQRIVYRKLKSLLVDLTTIQVQQETGQYDGLAQTNSMAGQQDVVLGPEYTFLANFRVEGSNWYGEPLLENIRGTFANWQDANDGAERYDRKIAGSHWIITYPVGSTKVAGVDTSNDEIAKALIDSLESSGSIAIPLEIKAYVEDLSDTTQHGGWNIDLKDPSAKQASFVERMQYCDKMFVRGLMLPERAVTEGQFGTKAEAGVHADLALTQRELEHRHLTRLINWHLVNPLLVWNFGPEAENTIRLVADPLVDAKLAFFRDLYKLLIAHPTASPNVIDALDLDGLMDSVGTPKTEELVPEDGESPEMLQAGTEMARLMGQLFKAANENPAIPKTITVQRS